MNVPREIADTVLLTAAWTGAAFWTVCLVHTALGAVFIRRMPDAGPREGSLPEPRVSVIFAYRDEKGAVLEACRSMLAQDHGPLEVIAVDDRSADGSGGTLDVLSADPRFKRLSVRELPAGWLGKNHALQLGADRASGEWLLFTDADVIFKKDTVRRALRTAELHGADHLALLPHVALRGPVENLFYRSFGTLFAVRFQPWASRFKRIRGFAGVGAFNMIRRGAYQRIGEHRAFAMDIADDVMLAKRVKDSGLRLMLASGEDAVSVRWFTGFKGMMNSIHKNAFRGLDYRVELAALGSATLILCAVMPLAGALFGPASARTASTVSFTAMVLLQFGWSRNALKNILYGVSMPAGILIVAAAVMRSTWCATRDQAVTWRGTAYPLKLLRRNAPL